MSQSLKKTQVDKSFRKERGTNTVMSKQKAPDVFCESPTGQCGWRTEAVKRREQEGWGKGGEVVEVQKGPKTRAYQGGMSLVRNEKPFGGLLGVGCGLGQLFSFIQWS